MVVAAQMGLPLSHQAGLVRVALVVEQVEEQPGPVLGVGVGQLIQALLMHRFGFLCGVSLLWLVPERIEQQ